VVLVRVGRRWRPQCWRWRAIERRRECVRVRARARVRARVRVDVRVNVAS
jgi:hypothetical protein